MSKRIAALAGVCLLAISSLASAGPGPASSPGTIVPTLRGAVGSGASAGADQAGWAATVAAIGATQSSAPTGTFDYATFQSGAQIEPGIYDAGGLTMSGNYESIRLVARVPGTVVIRIPAGQYFLTATGRVNQIEVSGITFVGGGGAFHLTHPGNNVNLQMSFTHNVFLNYTECAICNNAIDHPYLRVQDNIFMGAKGAQTIGVGWGGYVDQGVIENNAFLQNAYHLKIGPRISSSMLIAHNDFISWGDPVNRTQADIWLVPNTDVNSYGVNSGYGTSIVFNKFGLEHQNLAAPRILIAPEDTSRGTSRATWFPSTSTADTPRGYVSQLTVANNVVAASSGTSAPVILSAITNLRGLRWRENHFNGAPYSRIVQFATNRIGDYSNNDSVFDFDTSDTTAGNPPALQFSNAQFATLRDWAGFFPGDPNAVDVWPATDDPNAQLLLAAVTPASRVAFGGASAAPFADPRGRSSFSQVTTGSPGGGVATSLTGALPQGGKVFVEMELARAPSASIDQVNVDVRNTATGITAVRRSVTLPANNGRLILPVILPPSDVPGGWQLRVSAGRGYAPGRADRFVTGDWIVNTGHGRLGLARAMQSTAR